MRAAAACIQGATFESNLTRAVFESPLVAISRIGTRIGGHRQVFRSSMLTVGSWDLGLVLSWLLAHCQSVQETGVGVHCPKMQGICIYQLWHLAGGFVIVTLSGMEHS